GVDTGIQAPGDGNPLSIDISTLTANATHTLTVEATAGTGCSTTMTGSVDVTVNPLPTVFAITSTSPDAICEGGTYTLDLDGSQIVVTYETYSDDAATGITAAGDGNPISIDISTLAAGSTYALTIVATDDVTNCSVEMGSSVDLTVNPLPTVFNITNVGPDEICAGDTYTVN